MGRCFHLKHAEGNLSNGCLSNCGVFVVSALRDGSSKDGSTLSSIFDSGYEIHTHNPKLFHTNLGSILTFAIAVGYPSRHASLGACSWVCCSHTSACERVGKGLSRAVQRTRQRRPGVGHTPVGRATAGGSTAGWLGCWARRRRGSRRPTIERLGDRLRAWSGPARGRSCAAWPV
jgi:hypothetical protein